MAFAIIEAAGKQYRVLPGMRLCLEVPANAQLANRIVFDKVLMVERNGSVELGNPYVSGAKVEGIILGERRRGKKIIVFKYRPKTRYRKKLGYRSRCVEIEIRSIL